MDKAPHLVTNQLPFDLNALKIYLRKHIEGFCGELHIQQFHGGQSNPTYKLMTKDAQYVLRTKPAPASKLLPSAHAIDREFRVMDALSHTGFPVPKQIVLCTNEAEIGVAFYIMEFIEGRVLWDQSLPGM